MMKYQNNTKKPKAQVTKKSADNTRPGESTPGLDPKLWLYEVEVNDGIEQGKEMEIPVKVDQSTKGTKLNLAKQDILQ